MLLALESVLRPMPIGMVWKCFSFCMLEQKSRGIVLNIDVEGIVLNELTGSS